MIPYNRFEFLLKFDTFLNQLEYGARAIDISGSFDKILQECAILTSVKNWKKVLLVRCLE